MQRGFTLIELVCVIVILGVLATMAVPRVVDLSEEAYSAVVGSTAGAFEAGVRTAFYGCIVAGHAGQDNLPTFGQGNVDFNASCFPSSTNGNNGATVNANRCLQVWNGVLASAPSISTPVSGTTQFRAQGSGSTCTYTYRPEPDLYFTYNSADGAVWLSTP